MKYWLRRGSGQANAGTSTSQPTKCEATQGEYNSYYVKPEELKEDRPTFRSVSASPVSNQRVATPPALRKLSPVWSEGSRPYTPVDNTARRKPTPPSQELFSIKRAFTPPAVRKISPAWSQWSDQRPGSPMSVEVMKTKRKSTPPAHELSSSKLVQKAEDSRKSRDSRTLPIYRSTSPYSQLSSTPYAHSNLSAAGGLNAKEEVRRRNYSREEVDSAIDTLRSRTSSPK